MQKKFGINPTKIKGSCQSGRKVVTHSSEIDLPLVRFSIAFYKKILSVEEEAVEQKKKNLCFAFTKFFHACVCFELLQ